MTKPKLPEVHSLADNGLWVVLTGNIIDGMDVVGPFPTEEAAGAWCDEHGHDRGMWVRCCDPKLTIVDRLGNALHTADAWRS